MAIRLPPQLTPEDPPEFPAHKKYKACQVKNKGCYRVSQMLGTALALWYWASFAFLQKCKQIPSCIQYQSNFIQYGHILFKWSGGVEFITDTVLHPHIV